MRRRAARVLDEVRRRGDVARGLGDRELDAVAVGDRAALRGDGDVVDLLRRGRALAAVPRLDVPSQPRAQAGEASRTRKTANSSPIRRSIRPTGPSPPGVATAPPAGGHRVSRSARGGWRRAVRLGCDGLLPLGWRRSAASLAAAPAVCWATPAARSRSASCAVAGACAVAAGRRSRCAASRPAPARPARAPARSRRCRRRPRPRPSPGRARSGSAASSSLAARAASARSTSEVADLAGGRA